MHHFADQSLLKLLYQRAYVVAVVLLSLSACSSTGDAFTASQPGGGGSDTTNPTITITAPTTTATYTSASATLTTLAGTASDNVGVTQVTWVNSLGGSGTATGTTSWSVPSITLQNGTNVITVTARDAANNTRTDTISVNYSSGGGDTTPPTITITGPTSATTYTSASATLTTLAGTASDNVGVTQVTWVNSLGGSGTASGTTSWSVPSITLQNGTNVITVTARDAANYTSTDTISVSYSSGGGGGGLRAFPGAEGFGAAASGGRGGQVIRVTNLNASGPGSLQAALNVNTPRIIVFTVSGVIDGDITIPYGNVTIAGQTAPGAGITIRGRFYSAYSTGIDNIIIRHIRVRPLAYTPALGAIDQYDGMQFSLNRLGIFDHISVSFGVDETFDLYEMDDVTVQYSTIEQSSTLGTPGHNYGLINGPDGWRISVHHNLFAHNSNRNPAIANGPADVRNNVAYNVQHGFIHHNPASGAFNIIGNYYKQGPSAALYPFYFDDENGGTAPDLRYYMRDNYIDDPGDYVGVVENPWATPYLHPTFSGLGLPQSPYRVTTEHNFSSYSGYVPITTESSTSAYNTVLNRAGAWPRDVVTNKSVQDARDRTGSWGANVPSLSGLMAGLTPATAPVDSDNDGIPDSWELAHGLNPNNGSDYNTILPSGYTAIEEYINELADLIVP